MKQDSEFVFPPSILNQRWSLGVGNIARHETHLLQAGVNKFALNHTAPGFQPFSQLTPLSKREDWIIHLAARFAERDQVLSHLRELAGQEVLVVSGNPRRKGWTAVEVLKEVAESGVRLSVADFPQPHHSQLDAKLRAAKVERVVVQACTDLELLMKWVEKVRAIDPNLQLGASWLVPTRGNWHTMQRYKWNGAVFTSAWLADYNWAYESSLDVLNYLLQEGVEIWVESRNQIPSILSRISPLAPSATP